MAYYRLLQKDLPSKNEECDDKQIYTMLYPSRQIDPYSEKRPDIIFHCPVKYLDYKDVEIELDQHEIVLVLRFQQYLEGGQHKTVNKVVFKARIDTLYRVFHVVPSGKLHLCFYNEGLNCYRDIKVTVLSREDEVLAV
jgi:hypothetical protein